MSNVFGIESVAAGCSQPVACQWRERWRYEGGKGEQKEEDGAIETGTVERWDDPEPFFRQAVVKVRNLKDLLRRHNRRYKRDACLPIQQGERC